jgi:hypothetical protein
MDELQILDLIINFGNAAHAPSPPWEFLVTEFAKRLAEVSGKLTKNEVISLAAIAVACYRRGSDEFISGISADLLLKSLRSKGK